MRILLSKLKKIEDILLELDPENVFHYHAKDRTDKYIVWAEDSEGSSVEGDDHKINQSIQGTIDYFTKKDGDPMVDKIQEALTAACISFYLDSVQYEEETDLIHYEWIWEVS